ncbi:MAG: hypothetical protein ABJL99_07930 [Aliishimia sp.]
MSYDFELYTNRKLILDPPVTSGGSSVRVDGPERIEDENIPANYLTILGKKRVLFRIHLEGNVVASDQNAVDGWLRAIVFETKGVLIDLQTEHFESPTKSGQLEAQAGQLSSNGWMSFYFENGESFYESGFKEMLQVVSLLMPEAVPTRYGYYEPLQSRVEDGDISGLVSSFKSETDIFMKAKTPFGHIFTSIPCKKTLENWHPKHFVRREFLLCRVCFELRPKLFTHPGSLRRLNSLFEKLCVTLDVVYADIVQINDWGSWVWRGLPENKAHTICLGRAYQDVWPDALKTGQKIGSHHHLVTTDRFGNEPPRPPRDLIAPRQIDKNPGGKTDYASVFPFDYEFNYNKYIW